VNDCLRVINEAAGEQLPDSEVDAFLTALEAHKRYVKARDGLDDRSAALKAADELAERLKTAAIIEKRNAAMNHVRRLERVAWIGNNFGNNLALGIESMLVGTQRAKRGARISVASVQESLKKQYFAGFTTDLERSGHGELFASGALDRDVARALYVLRQDGGEKLLGKLPTEAVEVARIAAKWQEVTRLDANRAGAWIGKRDDYITRQSHDPERVRGRGKPEDYAAWREVALRTFDIEQMTSLSGALDVDNMLRGLWANLASGNHLKSAADDVASGFKGPSNIAKKLSESRSVLFKGPDEWFDYNDRFGTGNLRESVLHGLERSAQSTGLMQMMGTNPRAMLDAVRDDLTLQAKAAGKADTVAQLGTKRGELDRYMAAVDGSMNIAGNQMWARRAANVRAWETLAKLGGMLLSQLNDLAIYASGASYQGRGFFSGMSEAVGGLGRSLSAPERRELAASLGVVLDNMAGELGRVGSFSEAGSLSGLVGTFMKWNGSRWWTDRMRTSAAFGMSHHMALQSGKGWADLGAEYQRVLSLYEIGEAEWKLISGTAEKHVDGKAYIVPEALREVPDDAVRGYAGAAASDAQVATARRELEDKLRTYFVDQTSVLALEPDAKTRAIMLQGSRPGTWTGEFFRFAMQFKSFTGAYMQRVLGRELYGRGYEGDSIVGALRSGHGELAGIARLVAMSTIMGYGSMALKDMAKGRSPRDPTESPGDAAKIFLAAMVQGGGAGIYGDFLFGAASRSGSGTIESLAGPAISTAARVVDLYHKALEGDKFAARAFNEVLNNTPFMNLFYVRPVLNYMVLYQAQEWLSPGYLRRMERQVEANGQEFLMRPSEAVR
jgi:hypothetical protein